MWPQPLCTGEGGCTVYVNLIKVDGNIPQEPQKTTEHTYYVFPHLENRTKWHLGFISNVMITNGSDDTISVLVVEQFDQELALVLQIFVYKFDLINEFDFWKVYGIMSTLGLLQSWAPC